jgi:nitroreductase
MDAAMAVMLMLLTAVDEGVGAWWFGVFHGAEALLRDLGVPPGRRLVGAVALGRPAGDDRPSGSARTRPRRPFGQVVHWGRW